MNGTFCGDWVGCHKEGGQETNLILVCWNFEGWGELLCLSCWNKGGTEGGEVRSTIGGKEMGLSNGEERTGGVKGTVSMFDLQIKLIFGWTKRRGRRGFLECIRGQEEEGHKRGEKKK